MKKKRRGVSCGVFVVSLLLVLFLQCAFAQEAPGPALSGPAANRVTQMLAPPPSGFHEDWSSISLEKSTLDPDPPVRGLRDDIPGTNFIRELWQVSWRPADPLDLYIILPKGVTKPPVILYLYSYPANTNRFKDNNWCQAATSGGYAAVGFVSALTGHRAEYRPPNQSFVSELQESLATSAHDVQMILNFLATRGDLDMNRVGMYGEGSGGSIAILAAATDPRIKALNVLNPWGDWPDWLAKSKVVPEDQRATYSKPDFLARVAPLDPVLWLPKVKSSSVRIDNVRSTPLTPQVVQEKIEAVAPDSALIDQYGDGRAFVKTMVGEGLVFAWLKNQLQPNAIAATVTDKSQRVHYYAPVVDPVTPFGSAPSAPSVAPPKNEP